MMLLHILLILCSVSFGYSFFVSSPPPSERPNKIGSATLRCPRIPPSSLSALSSPPSADTTEQQHQEGEGNDEISSSSSNAAGANGRTIYSLPALYDLAFGYRNYEEEVDFLIEQHQLLHQGRAPQNVLELAAGPARHSLTALQLSYISAATAVDTSLEMKEYALELAQEELLESDNVQALQYVTADMTNFEMVDGNAFDSAWILLGSLQHLTTNEQVVRCFRCIHRCLNTGGTLIVELPHPREIFSLVECTRNGWEVPLEDENGNTSGELKIVWGDDDDEFDPITQIRQFTVSMELVEEEGGGGDKATTTKASSSNKALQSVKEVVPMRHFTSQEIDALAGISGFDVVSLHGALARDVDVNDTDEAFRLVCVLQKKDLLE